MPQNILRDSELKPGWFVILGLFVDGKDINSVDFVKLGKFLTTIISSILLAILVFGETISCCSL